MQMGCAIGDTVRDGLQKIIQQCLLFEVSVGDKEGYKDVSMELSQQVYRNQWTELGERVRGQYTGSSSS